MASLFQDLLSQTREKQTATLSEVKWQGRTVQVKNEPVRLFLLNLQDSTKEIESAEGIDSKISIYESLLKQCIDAQQVLRDTLQDDQVFLLFFILKNAKFCMQFAHVFLLIFLQMDNYGFCTFR